MTPTDSASNAGDQKVDSQDGAPVESAGEDTGLTPASHESSPRELLVRKLIDIVVLSAARISANERALTADTLLQVVDKVEEKLRIEIAVRVARVPEAPPALVRALLLDEPDVARPIIRGAETLPEALLIEAAREGSTAHREFIARAHRHYDVDCGRPHIV